MSNTEDIEQFEHEALTRICNVVNLHDRWTPELNHKVWKMCQLYGLQCCMTSNWEIAKGKYYKAVFNHFRTAIVSKLNYL